jgi:hypothetical protein
MRGGIRSLLIISVLLFFAVLTVRAVAQFDTTGLSAASGHGPRALSQAITSITLPTSYPSGSTSGYAVGTATVNMSPSSPAFSGTLAFVAPGNTTGFAVNSSTGAITLAANDPCASAPCTVDLQATPFNGTIAPYTQSGTITSTGSSAPAAALAGCSSVNGGGPSNGSCFSTLALNMDFTTSSAVSGLSNGTLFNAQVISNWLNCSNSSMLWQLGGAGQGNNAPCPSSWSIANDGGTNALLLSANANQEFSTTSEFPNQYYVEFRWRTDTTSDSNCNNGGYSLCQDIWTYDVGSGPVMEWDFIETTPTSLDQGGSNFNVGSPGKYWVQQNWKLVPGYNHDAYHTLGARITEDGTGAAAVCYYLDGAQVYIGSGTRVNNCESYLASDTVSDGSTLASNVASMNHAIQMIIWNSVSGTGNTVNMWLQYLRVWDCSNWTQAGQPAAGNNGLACEGAIITSNP